jgi:hypothetical protein
MLGSDFLDPESFKSGKTLAEKEYKHISSHVITRVYIYILL